MSEAEGAAGRAQPGGLRTAVVAVLLIACLLSGQGIVDSRLSSAGSAAAGAAIGHAGFAYLTGLRRFAAMLVFNRLEPQHDTYYRQTSLKDQIFVLPNLRLVLMLDPQFVQAYYIAPWVLLQNGRLGEAIAVARKGVADNPDSGLLHTSLAQVLYLKTDDLAGAVRQADLAMRSNQYWADDTEQWESMRILEDVYKKAGLPERKARAEQIRRVLERNRAAAPGVRDPNQQF